MTPQRIVPLAIDNVMTPARTGAQQVVAIAEKIPKRYTDETYFLKLSRTAVGAINFFPTNIESPRIMRKIPPVEKIILWYLLKRCAKDDIPSPMGRKIVSIPRKNTKVIKNILYFSLKMFPK